MDILQVTLFGSVRVSHNNWLTETKLTREIQALLAYLLLQRHRLHSRDALANIFWSEQSQEKARGSLNTALWKLKKALELDGIPSGTYLKISHSGDVGFNNESPHWIDIEVFEEKVNGVLAKPFQTLEKTFLLELQQTLRLYKGDLLEGCYRDWALFERERLGALYLKSLIYVLHYYACHGIYEKAISYGRRILQLNPLEEEIHRELMRLYLQNGQRALAVKQYEICRSTLVKELGILPMEDTQELYAQIIKDVYRHGEHIIFREPVSVDQVLLQLNQLNETVSLVQQQIQEAFQLISKYSEFLNEAFSSKVHGDSQIGSPKSKIR